MFTITDYIFSLNARINFQNMIFDIPHTTLLKSHTEQQNTIYEMLRPFNAILVYVIAAHLDANNILRASKI